MGNLQIGGLQWRAGLGVIRILAIATGGGIAGDVLQIPAGALLGSLVAVSSYNLWTDGAARLPGQVRDASRILVGTTIGSLVSPTLLLALGVHLPWAVVFAALMIISGLGCGWLLARLTGLDLRTALMCCVPGGMPEMTALADDINAQVDVVVGIHVLRKLLALLAAALVVELL